jgi:pyruvate dehydrogenase E2 component (dihydrolipoamide acetyltransferase)
MSTEIRMPRLVDSMTQGAVVAWRKREGESVRAGEVIAEIEADKTTVDLEAPEAGTLARIVVPAGSEKVDVGEVLAILDQPGGPVLAAAPELAAGSAGAASGDNGHPAQPAERPLASAGALMAPAPVPVPVPAPASTPVPHGDVQASPLARSMALQAGLDLSSLQGSGPGGRTVPADVLTALGFRPGLEREPEQARPERVARVDHRPATAEAAAPCDEVPHSRIRQVIAQRLGESKRTIPHFYLEVNCRIDALLRLRSELQASRGGGLKLSLNDLAIRAAALALRKVPEANASWTEVATRRYRRVDLAVAVATDAGLVAPVVRDADRKGLAELAAEVRDLAERARQGRLRPEELQGGTFTLSNLGMYGIDALYAIVNPPQAGILGLGKAEPRPVALDGSVVVATMMTCTLSADHRVLDGATGAKFLSVFKSLIEEPLTMML